MTGVVIHHQADGMGQDSLAYMVGANPRNSHPTYAIDDDAAGTVVGIIHPNLCPSSTGYDVDRAAVTFEVANVGGAPDWKVSDAAIEALAQIIAHHADESPRSAHPIVVNQPGKTQKGFWVGWHSQYEATGCPGPHLRGQIPAIVARANAIRAQQPASVTPSKPSTPKPAAPTGGGSTATSKEDDDMIIIVERKNSSLAKGIYDPKTGRIARQISKAENNMLRAGQGASNGNIVYALVSDADYKALLG